MELGNWKVMFKKEFQGLDLGYRVTPHSTTGLSPAEQLMRWKLCTHLDLLHPDMSHTFIEKQDKLATVTKRC